MKKVYNNPKTHVHNIVLANLCSVSPGSANLYSTKTGASGALSREGRDSDWGDDED